MCKSLLLWPPPPVLRPCCLKNLHEENSGRLRGGGVGRGGLEFYCRNIKIWERDDSDSDAGESPSYRRETDEQGRDGENTPVLRCK